MLKNAAVVIALVAASFLAGLVLTGRLGSSQESAARQVSPAASGPAASAAVSPPALAGLPDFTRVAETAVRGVVNIASEQIVRTTASPFANDPFFNYFFGDADLFGPQTRRALSLGSGVIVSADGYVVTNSHVVGENVEAINLTFGDKRELRGRIVGTDPMTDIALVKVTASALPVVQWGDSSRLKVGEWVLAIGSPFQLSQTVTLGIVSAVGRANVGFADYEDFIQTDAAINPGNSGGALINARGELIGINTGILSKSGGYQGIGFAVPSNLARRVLDDLKAYGQVRRGSIGAIEIAPLTTQLAEELGVTSTRGALVWKIGRTSEAYRAGLRPGDVIVSFNGQVVEDASHFLRLLADAKIGSTAPVGIIRDGKQVDLNIPIVQGQRRRG